MVRLSILDSSPIASGSSPRDAIRQSVELARRAEQLGYERFWLTEHHNMPGMASSATAVLIAHIVGQTTRIRVGAGGIMLANHSPLIVAEQFATLASLFPGRIDLGLGRASGADAATTRVLQRRRIPGDHFKSDVDDVIAYLWAPDARRGIFPIPGGPVKVPIWMLGSGLESAALAAALGLPFAFAAHFSPDKLEPAIEIYASRFTPSEQLAKPHLMLGINVVVADSDSEAETLASSMQHSALCIADGCPMPLQPPRTAYMASLPSNDQGRLRHILKYSVLGTAASVVEQLDKFARRTGADELAIVTSCFDFPARLRSYELLAAGLNSNASHAFSLFRPAP